MRDKPKKGTAAQRRKKDALVKSIKRDVAAGRVVTLIALSAAEIQEFAAKFTKKELRLIRFTIPGVCLYYAREKRR